MCTGTGKLASELGKPIRLNQTVARKEIIYFLIIVRFEAKSNIF
jgi:hypothetical protein